jgi:FMN phosphatase YigB (HAD superfamily)
VRTQRTQQIHKPKAVIFDIGRVIVRLQPEIAFAPLAKALPRSTAEDVWRLILNDARWNDWQEGRLQAREWHEHLTQRLEISLPFEQFCACWNQALHRQTILSERLFAALSQHCKLAVLSNTDPLHSKLMEAEFSFLAHFPVRIYSWQVGASKPSPEIFKTALKALDVAANEAFYIDDIPEFADAARKVGMDACIFESPEQLYNELRRRGLPPE